MKTLKLFKKLGQVIKLSCHEIQKYIKNTAMTQSQSQILLMTFPHLLLRLFPQKSNLKKKQFEFYQKMLIFS